MEPGAPAPEAAAAGAAGESVPDVAAIVAELRAEVQRKRDTGELPAALLARLRTEFRPGSEWEPPEAVMLIESARPLRSNRPGVGPAIVFAKRAVRRLLAWYVAPIAQEQTRFNQAILRELRALELRVARLEERSPGPTDPPSAGPPGSAGSPEDGDTARGGQPQR